MKSSYVPKEIEVRSNNRRGEQEKGMKMPGEFRQRRRQGDGKESATWREKITGQKGEVVQDRQEGKIWNLRHELRREVKPR